MEGNRIYKEEMIKKVEDNHRSQSLINSIRNSHTLLETIKKHGSEMQVFRMTEKMMSQLISYLDQIQENYTKTETTVVQLEVNPQFQCILSADPHSLAKIICRQELQSLPVPGLKKSPRDCMVQRNRIIEIKGDDHSLVCCTGITYLYSGNVILVIDNRMVCLLDSSYNSIASYLSPYHSYYICVADDDEVAMTLPYRKTVQFLSVKNGKITPTSKIPTRYKRYGVAAAGKGKIVISGVSNETCKYYWSLICSGWKKESCHEFDCQSSGSFTHVALDSCFKHIYISVNLTHSLYCFDMSGSQMFVYSHDILKNPRGVATDKYDNVYVIGYGSNNIHQLTPDGIVHHIISDGVPAYPITICFNRDGVEFLVTYQSDKGKLYQYQLK